MAKTVISVEHLSKRYDLGVINTGTLSRDLNRWWARMRGKPDPYLKIGQTDHGNQVGSSILALNDISFEVKEGEALGIIGRNGAGKSTLLKILSRVTAPTAGKVKINGRIGSLLEVGTGFHPELTGRENIFLNGAILGMSRKEVELKFDEIVDFAGVERFIDTPVKRYSSGMYVRLAFAVAAHLDPEILVVDEVLAVGDAEFQKKCLGKMDNVAKTGRTILFVSHNMGAIQGLCNRALLLENGIIKFQGKTENTINHYLDTSQAKNEPLIIKKKDSLKEIQITELAVQSIGGDVCKNFPLNAPIIIRSKIILENPIKNFYLAMHIHDSNLGSLIFFRDFEFNKQLLERRSPGEYTYKVKIPAPLLAPGRYSISVHAVVIGEGIIDRIDNDCHFTIYNDGNERAIKGFKWIGKINPPLKLSISEKKDNINIDR